MTATLNASTSSGVVLTSDTSGSLAIQSNGTTIMTVASTGVSTQVGSPTFSAYQSTQQSSLSSNVNTLVQFQTKEFDTGTCFNNTGSTVTLNGVSAPQYSFAPNVAGYYNIILSIATQTSSTALYLKKDLTMLLFVFDSVSQCQQQTLVILF